LRLHRLLSANFFLEETVQLQRLPPGSFNALSLKPHSFGVLRIFSTKLWSGLGTSILPEATSQEESMKIVLLLLLIFIHSAIPGSVNAVTDIELKSFECNGCHGPNGVSSGENIPSIAGLEKRYFMRIMMEFKKGERSATIMDRIAKGYRASDIRKIAEYFSTLEWVNSEHAEDQQLVQAGKKIHDELCEECHSENGQHQDHEIPRISGQVRGYLYMQMLDYYQGNEVLPQPEKMKERIITLKQHELEALSHFYASGK
jgi:cytochrome subunit of sulfide dehydrogenase